MDRTEFIEKLQTILKKQDIQQIEKGVKCILQRMTQALCTRERLEIRGFGAFSVCQITARLARNPKTGIIIQVPMKYRIHFKPGKELKEMVNHEPEQHR